MINKKERPLKTKIKIVLILLLSISTFLLFVIQRDIKKEADNFPSKIELVFEEKNEVYQRLINERELIEEKYIFSEVEEKTFYSLEFIPKDDSRKNFIKEKLLEDIKITSKEEQKEIKLVDFTESSKNLSKYYYGLIFLFEIAALIFITVYLIESLKLNIKKYKKGIKRKYVKELLSENMTTVLLQILKTVLLVFLWIFLLTLILEFKLSTPTRFLPPTDIFDFQFYSEVGNVIKEEYRQTAAGYGNVYINLMERARGYFIISVISLVGLLLVSLSYMRERYKMEGKKLNKVDIERGEIHGKSVI